MALRALVRLVFGAALALAPGCVASPELSELPPEPEVSFAPAHLGQPLNVVRFTVHGARELDPEDVLLFEGDVSDARLARLREGELPKALAAARVPLLAWAADAELCAQPLRELTPGAPYTLAELQVGALARFVVSEQTLPRLARLWPLPTEAGPAGGQVVLCGEAIPSSPAVQLDPGGIRAEVVRDFGVHAEEPCVLLRFDASALEGRTLVLAPELDGLTLDPAPLTLGVRTADLVFPVCGADEVELGPGCARVEDDRLALRNADQALLYRFYSLAREGVPRLEAAAPNGVFVVHGLEPASAVEIRGTVIATDGAEAPFAVRVATAPARTRLVLNEVLANPRGPEPASEWVELFNAGRDEVNLAGMQLRDAGGTVQLPEARIPPGGFALLVREDFVVSASDVTPPPDALLVRVSVLGKNGLSNSGESLSLLDAAGAILSEFPALPAAHAGVSVARRYPDALASDGSTFAEHAEPGASPGAPNVTAEAR